MNEPPRDGAKFNGVRLSTDFLSEGLGLSTVEEDHLLGILGGEFGSRSSSRNRHQRRRRRGVGVVNVVFVHVVHVLN